MISWVWRDYARYFSSFSFLWVLIFCNVHVLYSPIKIRIKISTHKRNVNPALEFTVSLSVSTVTTEAFIYIIFYVGIIVTIYITQSFLLWSPPTFCYIAWKIVIITQDPTAASCLLMCDVYISQAGTAALYNWAPLYLNRSSISYHCPGMFCILPGVDSLVLGPPCALSMTELIQFTVLVTAFLILPLSPNLIHPQEVPSPPCQPSAHPWLGSLSTPFNLRCNITLPGSAAIPCVLMLPSEPRWKLCAGRQC